MQRLLRGLFLLGFGLTALTVMAQSTPNPSPTPTPVPQFIKGWNAESFFPHGIIFYFDAIIPLESQVASISLVIEPDGGRTSTVAVPLTEDGGFVRTGDSIASTFVWEIPSAGAAPRLFSDVAYTWNIRLNTGEVDTITDRVSFTDQRAEWRVVPADDLPLRLVFFDETIFPELLFDDLAGVFGLLADLVGFTLDDPANFIVYSDEIPIGCMAGDDGERVVTSETYDITRPCDTEFEQVLYERSDFFPLQIPLSGATALQRAITDTLIQAAYPNLQSAPDWFQFGYARLLDPPSDIQFLAPALFAARSNALIESIGALEIVPAESDQDRRVLWEAQSFGLVLFIAERFGLEAVYMLADEVREQESFDALYRSVTDESLDALFLAWEVWLFSDEAARVYNLDLYGIPTPTATAIRTATPLPPSRTPRPTWTPTVTLTITPTSTPLPPSPTPTLRLAADVFTPTPTPTPTPESLIPGTTLNREQALFILLGVVVLSIGLIGIGGALSSRRR